MNNCVNENIYNANKSSTMSYQIKKFLKLFRKNKSNTYKQQPQPVYFEDEQQQEIEDNLANELLENEIFEEIDHCDENGAVPVYQNGHLDIVPVFRGQRYIPVHFARTQAGTFFWTSILGPDCDVMKDGDSQPITANQTAELQVAQRCRWAQA